MSRSVITYMLVMSANAHLLLISPQYIHSADIIHRVSTCESTFGKRKCVKFYDSGHQKAATRCVQTLMGKEVIIRALSFTRCQ